MLRCIVVSLYCIGYVKLEMERYSGQIETVFAGKDIPNCLFRSAADGALSVVSRDSNLSNPQVGRQMSLLLTNLELARDNLQKALQYKS